jgi:fumarate hydratase, class I
MPEFDFTELLPLGHDSTEYRLLTTDGVSTLETAAGVFLPVEPRMNQPVQSRQQKRTS